MPQCTQKRIEFGRLGHPVIAADFSGGDPSRAGGLLRACGHRHFGAHVGQHARGQRAVPNTIEFNDVHARKWHMQGRCDALILPAIRSFMVSVVPP